MHSVPITPPADLAAQVALALAEDIGGGDVTAALIPVERAGRATIVTREDAVLCGIQWADATFAQLDGAVRLRWAAAEGARIAPGQVLAELSGPARSLLTGERTALNFLQLLSATATAAQRYAARIAGSGCRLLDTRKTLPGLRTAQKYAVRVGGGTNHRMGLYDAVLIKENHIVAAGSIAAAVGRARAAGDAVPIEVEVETLAELQQAIDAGADIALLDDFPLQLLEQAVAVNRAARRPLRLEASGGVDLDSIGAIAATGVDFVSVGAITKHVRAVDLSMRFAWA
jgi:nicotinate-nucleotide pyrophosphorylase (carboxylating)